MGPMKRSIHFLVLILAAGLVSAGAFQALTRTPETMFTLGNNPDLPVLTFYTTGLATTPQIAFWHAVDKGRILEKCNIKVILWKNLDDLRGILLAGKGDLWLGHTDGFVQAARRGAPVRLMITTGWRKFYLVSTRAAPARFNEFYGDSLAFAPPGSPAIPILRHILPDRQKIIFLSHEPRQLAVKLIQGDITSALVPEPLVTTLLEKVPGLKQGQSLEDLYGRYTKGPARMPIAGLAVNAATADRYPKLIAFLAKEILASALVLSNDPAQGIASLPTAFESFVSRDLIRKSLTRDLFLAQKSYEIRDEIRQYLCLATGPGKEMVLPDTIFWR